MSGATVDTTGSGDVNGTHPLRERPRLAVEISFYGPEEPVTIPLPGLDAAKAQSYFQRLKSDVIEAQLHTDPHISIKVFARGQDELVLDPSTIQQVLLVDLSEPDEPTTDEIPTVASRGIEADPGSRHRAADAELTDDVQRRIDILLG